MTRRHRQILRRAAKVGSYFQAEGKDARPAWELLRANLIEGEPVEDKDGVPCMVSVLGITLAGREELARPFSRISEWIVHTLDIALGTVIGAAITKLLSS